MNNTDITLFIVAAVLLLPGLVGIFVPLIPGIPYMFIVSLLYALLTRFKFLTWSQLLFLGILAALSILVDYLSGIIGAKYGGARKNSLYYGLAGLIIGTFFFPVVGSIVGLFAGIFLAEYLFHRNQKRASKAAIHGVIGSLGGILINLLLGIVFIITFIIFILK